MFGKVKRKNLSIEDIQESINAAKLRMELEQIQRVETTFQRILKKVNRGQYSIYKDMLVVDVRVPLRQDYAEKALLAEKFEGTRLALDDCNDNYNLFSFNRQRVYLKIR